MVLRTGQIKVFILVLVNIVFMANLVFYPAAVYAEEVQKVAQVEQDTQKKQSAKTDVVIIEFIRKGTLSIELSEVRLTERLRDFMVKTGKYNVKGLVTSEKVAADGSSTRDILSDTQKLDKIASESGTQIAVTGSIVKSSEQSNNLLISIRLVDMITGEVVKTYTFKTKENIDAIYAELEKAAYNLAGVPMKYSSSSSTKYLIFGAMALAAIAIMASGKSSDSNSNSGGEIEVTVPGW